MVPSFFMATFPGSSGFEAGRLPVTQLDKRKQARRKAGTFFIDSQGLQANQLVFSKKRSS
jgi:hypothetical protein